MRTRGRSWLSVFSILALFALIVVLRMATVALFSSSIPIWDEWDAEGATLIKPWVEGRLELSSLVAPHNEHRILWTRLLALALFELNDHQWDNLISANANAFLYAACMAFLYWALARSLPSRALRTFFFLAILVLSALPFGHANTLVGFQSQFYMMMGVTLVALFLASWGENVAHWALLFAASAIGCFTMASGLLAPVAAVVVLGLRVWQGFPVRTAAAVAALLLAIAGAAYASIPFIAGHQTLMAPDFATWLRALGIAAGWPLNQGGWGALALYAPTIVLGARVVRRRRSSGGERCALGLSAWALLQCAAMAHSRGQGMTSPASRYTDILAVGVLVNFWIALHLLQRDDATGDQRSIPAFDGWVALLLSANAAAAGFFACTPADLAACERHVWLSKEQTRRVGAFVLDGNPSHLKAPHLHIPYPSAHRLQVYLQDPTLRSVLPATVRAPIATSPAEADGAFSAENRDGGYAANSCECQRCQDGRGHWISASLSTSFPYIEVPLLVEGGVATALRLGTLAGTAEVRWTELENLRLRGAGRRYFTTRGKTFRLAARDSDSRACLRIAGPREIGRLSMVCARTQSWVRRWRSRLLPGDPH